MQRLGFLNFTSAAGIAPEEVVRHYLVAACDSADAAGRVGRRGDELLRKRCAVDSPKPVVDLEDGASVSRMGLLEPSTASLHAVNSIWSSGADATGRMYG